MIIVFNGIEGSWEAPFKIKAGHWLYHTADVQLEYNNKLVLDGHIPIPKHEGAFGLVKVMLKYALREGGITQQTHDIMLLKCCELLI
jgi:hypothetical protein